MDITMQNFPYADFETYTHLSPDTGKYFGGFIFTVYRGYANDISNKAILNKNSDETAMFDTKEECESACAQAGMRLVKEFND